MDQPKLTLPYTGTLHRIIAKNNIAKVMWPIAVNGIANLICIRLKTRYLETRQINPGPSVAKVPCGGMDYSLAPCISPFLPCLSLLPLPFRVSLLFLFYSSSLPSLFYLPSSLHLLSPFLRLSLASSHVLEQTPPACFSFPRPPCLRTAPCLPHFHDSCAYRMGVTAACRKETVTVSFIFI